GQADAFGAEGLAALAGLIPADLEVQDVALVLEHLGQLGLQARRRHLDRRLLDAHGVADAGQHVCQRIGHHRWVFLPTRLADAGDHPVAGQAAETDAAGAELPVHGPRPAADLAAQADADQVARPQLRLRRLALVRLQRLELLAERGIFRISGHGVAVGFGGYWSRNGMPKSLSSSRASSSLSVLV